MTSRGVATRSGLARLDRPHQAAFDALTRGSGGDVRAAKALGCDVSTIWKLQHGGTAAATTVERVTAALDRLATAKEGA